MKKLVLLRGACGSLPRSSISVLRAPVFAALGNFDGVHLGHQQLIARLQEQRARAGGGTLLMISFYPHPLQVLRPELKISVLTPLRQKIELCAALGVDAFALLHFTPELAALSADAFIEKILLTALKVDYLCVGPDARVGAGRMGNPELIAARFAARGKTLEVHSFLAADGEKISSGVIRRLVESGDVARAQKLLGRPYTLDSRVVHGDRRGITIGVPTANQTLFGQVLPALGVYASIAEVGGQSYVAVTNVGTRPTFGGVRIVGETHLLNYSGADFYGSRLKVKLMQRLRGEQRFQSVDALVAQIHHDMEAARCLLEKKS